ncbi:MAG: phosphoribosylglycinamide formyltransferase [Alphaproteobacteria bacterium]|nr:phosphoribosylglycinamide formyltransferase [Alphaproteobacteria bacterium]HCP00318.1 phosphoribosylglycinamide formyltransferase [Rhodospirillaceae bacterium]
MDRLKIGVLISGRGSNLRALIDACAAEDFPAEINLVLSNKLDARGLAHAEATGIDTVVIEHDKFPDRESFDRAIDAVLKAANVELVCLAGFMRLLSTWFVETWRDRVVNIHPSLLPAFKGIDAHAQAIAAGVRLSGCTVHIVRPEMDAGPVLVQAAVPVMPDDDEDTLAARILAAEHRCYPYAIRLLAEGRVKIVGERAEDQAPGSTAATLIHPAIE